MAAKQPDEIEEFPIVFIEQRFQEAMRFLKAHGFRPKNTDEAMGIRISAQAIGKEELRQAAARVEQYAGIIDDYAD